MRYRATYGPLTAIVRECWLLASNRRVSCEQEDYFKEPTIHAIVVESVNVEIPHQRQGYWTRFINQLCADERFDMVVVEGVGNPILAEYLKIRGWECDARVMDFYKARAVGVDKSASA